MAQVVVLGAGIGGMTAAYDLRGEPNKQDHTVTVIGDKPAFEFTPSNPRIAVGWRQRTDTSINVEKYLFKKKINFIASKATNIDAEIAGKQPKETATWNAICLADMGDTGAAFVAILQIPPRNVTWFKEGKWVYLAKLAYEKYFLNKLKRGGTEPVCGKYIPKMLGINRLKSEESTRTCAVY